MAGAISAQQLRALLESEELYALVDVRDWGEFVLGQIPGASPLSRGYLEKYLPVLVPKTEVKVCLYCDSGQRSALASVTVEALGYSDVSILSGGLKNWKTAGYETAHGWSLRGKEYAERLRVEERIPEVTVEELRASQARGEELYIFDTRTRPEHSATHLPGAVCGSQLVLDVADVVENQDLPIVTNCAGRTRSILGAHLLRRMGFRKAGALRGGTGAWRIAGYESELETGPATGKQPYSEAAKALSARFANRVAVEDGLSSLGPHELEARRQAGELFYLLDVRLPEEYIAGHIPGARFCPGAQVALLVESLVGVNNATIVTACDDSRVRAIVAASVLKGMCYPHVYVLDGGVDGWATAGLPLEAGTPYEIDYGLPGWLARLLQGLPAGVDPQPLPIPGLAQARLQTTFLSAAALKAGLDERPALVDVRGLGDFATAHIPGARWLSRGRLELEIERQIPERDKQLVLYCRKGSESTLSVPSLGRLGYQRVTVLEGGFDAWTWAGFPIERGLQEQAELEELAIAETGLFGGGPYGFSLERMAQYLRDEEALGAKYKPRR